MNRQLTISLLVTAILAVISLVFFFDTTQQLRLSEAEVTEPGFSLPEDALFEPGDPPVEVRVFFPTQNNDLLLRSRDLTIFASENAANRARQIIGHLITGTDDDLLFGRLPDGTEVEQVFISADGTAYLDFNSALSDNHPGGILPELATVYAITNSLVYNLEDVDRVKILIGGVERETLAGHCMLLLPLGLDLSITDIIVPEAA